ncbi:MAG: NADH:flavin oxidoreductase, partial [Desulfobacterales bacterium]|nr:NADH:flavin oxidoreductase [Desulfobacterales bacterium]
IFTSAGRPVTLEGFDTVVVAESMTAVRDVKPLLDRYHVELHVIGDAKKPRHLMPAIAEAEEIGRAL